MRSTLEREQRHRSSNSFGERYGGSADSIATPKLPLLLIVGSLSQRITIALHVWDILGIWYIQSQWYYSAKESRLLLSCTSFGIQESGSFLCHAAKQGRSGERAVVFLGFRYGTRWHQLISDGLAQGRKGRHRPMTFPIRTMVSGSNRCRVPSVVMTMAASGSNMTRPNQPLASHPSQA